AEQGLATCLDSALLFASAIEQAGLNPVIVLTKGHALAGAWLQPKTLRSLTEDDPSELRKAIADSEMVLFETTLVTGNQVRAVSAAVNEGNRQVDQEHENDFVYALDVKRARGHDIRPLAALVEMAPADPADDNLSTSQASLEAAP